MYHSDLMLSIIADEMKRFACKHKTSLDHHVNPLAIQSLENPKDTGRLNPFQAI